MNFRKTDMAHKMVTKFKEAFFFFYIYLTYYFSITNKSFVFFPDIITLRVPNYKVCLIIVLYVCVWGGGGEEGQLIMLRRETNYLNLALNSTNLLKNIIYLKPSAVTSYYFRFLTMSLNIFKIKLSIFFFIFNG